VEGVARSVRLGLEFAHRHGIGHRGLKPGNIWLAPDPSPASGGSGQATAKIGDFGLAVFIDSPRLTREGMMVGTLSPRRNL
jgi:serine/threonine protein kinase